MFEIHSYLYSCITITITITNSLIIRHGIFPFFNGNPFFSEAFGSFLRLMQIRFNNFRGGGGVMQLFSKFMVCQSFLCVIFIGYNQH